MEDQGAEHIITFVDDAADAADNVAESSNAAESNEEQTAAEPAPTSEPPKIYTTPFNRTILYRVGDEFGQTAAFVSSRAQPVPIIDPASVDEAVNTLPYISPYLVVMDDFCTEEQLKSYLKLGFKNVLVFDRSAGVMTGDHPIERFGLDAIYDVLNVGGMEAVLILESIICGKFKDYKSEFLAADRAKWLRQGLFSCVDYIDTIMNITNSWNGFQIIEDMICRGKVLHDIKKDVVNERVSRFTVHCDVKHGESTYHIAALYVDDFVKQTRKALRNVKHNGDKCDFYVLYRYEQSGFRVMIVPGKLANAAAVATEIIDAGTEGLVAPDKLYNLLPFLR